MIISRARVRWALVLVAILLPLAACAPPPADAITVKLERIAACESHGNYRAVSKSGKFRGKYQFDQSTWNSVASRWLPSAVGHDPAGAPPAAQDHLARHLYLERGARPWPHCGYV